jgi:osmotically-inducible protein OsmY
MQYNYWLILCTALALSACSSIDGTSAADVSELTSPHDRRTPSAIVTDQHIVMNANKELNDHPDIRDKTHFNINSFNGVVLVTGEAASAALRSKIISIVRVIPNVKLVHNEMTIGQPSSSSARSNNAHITAQVKTALTKIDNIPGFDPTLVKVVTENRTVFLMGLVNKKEADQAGEAARHVADVAKVVKIFEYID